jgi:hypothetical protein
LSHRRHHANHHHHRIHINLMVIVHSRTVSDPMELCQGCRLHRCLLYRPPIAIQLAIVDLLMVLITIHQVSNETLLRAGLGPLYLHHRYHRCMAMVLLVLYRLPSAHLYYLHHLQLMKAVVRVFLLLCHCLAQHGIRLHLLIRLFRIVIYSIALSPPSYGQMELPLLDLIEFYHLFQRV